MLIRGADGFGLFCVAVVDVLVEDGGELLDNLVAVECGHEAAIDEGNPAGFDRLETIFAAERQAGDARRPATFPAA